MNFLAIIIHTMLRGLSNPLSSIVINSLSTYTFLIIKNSVELICCLRNPIKLFRTLKTVNQWNIDLVITSSILTTISMFTFYLTLMVMPVSIILSAGNVSYIIISFTMGTLFFNKAYPNKFYFLLMILLPSSSLLFLDGYNIAEGVSLVGVLLIFCTSILQVISSQIDKKIVKEVPIQTLEFFKLFISVTFIGFLIMFIVEVDVKEELYKTTPLVISLFIYLSISSTIISLLSNKIKREFNKTVIKIFESTTPLFSAVFSITILQESISQNQITGILLTIIILYFMKNK